MGKTKEQTEGSMLRIIMSRHGEGLHNVAGRKISKIWKEKEAKIRSEITTQCGNTPEINETLDRIFKEAKSERYDIAYNTLEEVDAQKYKDPSLTERGEIQAFYSGKSLQAYAAKKGLQLSPLVFASPFARTIDSLEEVLKTVGVSQQERYAIPDLMETSGRYVDTYNEHKDCNEYEVLGEGIDVQEVMKGKESHDQVVERATRGLEKVHKKLKGKEEALPIVVIHGVVMTLFSNKFFQEGHAGKVENSELWDLELSFDASGKFQNAKLIEKINMEPLLKKEYDEKLDSLEPSEKILETQDFSPVEQGLSTFANELKEKAVAEISGKREARSVSFHEPELPLESFAALARSPKTDASIGGGRDSIERTRKKKRRNSFVKRL